MKNKPLLTLVAISLLGMIRPAFATSSSAASHDVVFMTGVNASIIWFEIDDPSVGGTLNVTNPPYAVDAALNGAAIDLDSNRLIFDVDPHHVAGATVPGYAINLAGVQLIQDGVTSVTASSIGSWHGGGDTAAYNSSDGNIYYRVDGSDELRSLTLNSSGGISGYTSVGNFNGSGLTTSLTEGDIAFDSANSIWMTGTDANGTALLWDFSGSTLGLINSVDTPQEYNGIAFDAAGNTLYGYNAVTDQYGTLNTATGGFQTVLATDPIRFGNSGDFAEAIETVVTVPEPAISWIAAAGCLALRRRRQL